MKYRAPKLFSLQTFLSAVMLVATVPLALLLAYQVFCDLQAQHQGMRQELQRAATQLAVQIEREPDSGRWPGLLIEGLPTGGLARLTDAQGHVLASADPGGVTARQTPVYSAVQALGSTGLTVNVAVPRALLDDVQRRAILAALATITACLLLGLALATLVARRVTDPLRELATRGSAHTPPGLAPRVLEIAQLHEALTQAQAEQKAVELERLELAAMEQHARIEAENANRSKDEFLAMLGHELRNPLGAIASASEVLNQVANRAGPPAAADAELTHQARQVVSRQTRHLAHLVDDLLDVGRVISGKVRLSRQRLDMAALVQRVVENFRFTGSTDRHALTVQLEPAWVDADSTRIEQVVNNLMGNALKYTPAGRNIEVRLRTGGGQAILEVRDHGDGIAPHTLPHIFDLFVQGERPLDRRSGGLGLGLTLVRRLTEMHGGSVEASSSNKGSLFTVRLPLLMPPVMPPAEAPQPQAPRNRHAQRVLLVEDNEDARATMQAMLELDGHQVCTAADGMRGLARLLDERPDVAIVDIGLPGLNGFDLAKEGRRGGFAGRLLALSGYSGEADVAKALRHGFDAHMAKPVDVERLRRLLADDSSVTANGVA